MSMDDFDFTEDILRVIEELQTALPRDFKPKRKPVSISPAVRVKFPTQESSLSRLCHLAEQAGSESPIIIKRYLQSCLELQDVITRRLLEITKDLESLEEFGGASDLSLQSQVARGLSHIYETWESKLADKINQRYEMPATITKEDPQLGKVRPPLSPFLPLR